MQIYLWRTLIDIKKIKILNFSIKIFCSSLEIILYFISLSDTSVFDVTQYGVLVKPNSVQF